jgi:hypothetical protein
LILGFLQYFISKISAEKARSVQVNLSSKEFREFVLHVEERKTRFLAFLKNHQHINVTIRHEIVPQSGAKNGKSLNMMPPAKNRNLISRYDQVLVHHAIGDYFTARPVR